MSEATYLYEKSNGRLWNMSQSFGRLGTVNCKHDCGESLWSVEASTWICRSTGWKCCSSGGKSIKKPTREPNGEARQIKSTEGLKEPVLGAPGSSPRVSG